MSRSTCTPVPAVDPGRDADVPLLCDRTDKVQKRASNVLKLAQENAKLQEELRAMNARLEAAEKKQAELRRLEALQAGRQEGQAAKRATAA